MSTEGPEGLAKRLAAVEATFVSTVQKGYRPPFVMSGTGSVLTDLEGNTLLDFTSCFGVNALGYSNPRIRACGHAQLDRLVHTMSGVLLHASYVQCLESIVMAVGRAGHPEVLMTVSGSEAIEVALKLAHAATGRSDYIAFENSFHGQSLGTLGVTGQEALWRPLERITRQSSRIPYPRESAGEHGVVAVCDSIIELVRKNPAQFAAVIVEPMQNTAGYVVPPRGFMSALRRVTQELGLLLIADEIFTGFGRTGYWLLCDEEHIVPDITVVGKSMTGGMPCAACVADQSIMRALSSSASIPLHGSTFFAQPLTCAIVNEVITILKEDDLIDAVRRKGAKLKTALVQSCQEFPIVSDVRGKGLAIAVELSAPPDGVPAHSVAWEVAARLQRAGVMSLVSGLPQCNVLTFCPPFVVTDDEIAMCAKALAEVLREMSIVT